MEDVRTFGCPSSTERLRGTFITYGIAGSIEIAKGVRKNDDQPSTVTDRHDSIRTQQPVRFPLGSQ